MKVREDVVGAMERIRPVRVGARRARPQRAIALEAAWCSWGSLELDRYPATVEQGGECTLKRVAQGPKGMT